MSLPKRIWRLIRAELNHRMGRFEKPNTLYEPYEAYEEPKEQRQQTSARREPSMAEHYKTLEVPYGTDLEGVRAAYRQLMKRYHPDKQQDPEKKAAATELVKKINAAYTALTKHLETEA